jgi:hypothetical protein
MEAHVQMAQQLADAITNNPHASPAAMRAEMQAHALTVERLADQAARHNAGSVSSAEMDAHLFIVEEVILKS